jgi:DNA-binding NarL/FixJ family response regulator
MSEGPGGYAPGAGDEIRVLIADDEALIRAGFKVLIESAPDLRVVGEASDAIRVVPSGSWQPATRC